MKKTTPGTKKNAEGLTSPATQAIDANTAGDLRPAGYNPRTISPEKLEMLRKAMAEYGDLGGIVFNIRTGRTVGGHQRIKNFDPTWPITKQPHTDKTGTVAVGHIETPEGRWSYREVDWPESKEKAANIAANKHGGDWDDDLLTQLLSELYQGGLDMDLVGFDAAELEELLGLKKNEKLGDEEAVVEPPLEPFVRLGDLWACGDHRILCGDSTSTADIDRLMMGEKADLVVTDPPYGVSYETKAGKIENDNLTDAAFEKFLADVFSAMNYALKPGGCFYVYHADGGTLGGIFRNTINKTKGLLLKQCLIWVKTSATLCRSDYNYQHEPIIYGWKEGSAHYYDGDFTRTSVIDDDTDFSRMDKKQLLVAVNELRNRIPTTVIRVEKPAKNDIHPTVKPVRLFERNVYASSRQGEIVLDLFGGSGTILITCRKTNRRARAMELSPGYLQASLQRYWDYCAEEPQLIGKDGKLTPFSVVKKERGK